MSITECIIGLKFSFSIISVSEKVTMFSQVQLSQASYQSLSSIISNSLMWHDCLFYKHFSSTCMHLVHQRSMAIIVTVINTFQQYAS